MPSMNGNKAHVIPTPLDDIQYAHDLLKFFLSDHEELEELKFEVVSPQVTAEMGASLNVLCWVLGHDDNPQFGENLKQLEASLDEIGIHLEFDLGDDL